MNAKDFKVGRKFKNINTDEIITVIEEDGIKYFEAECGDIYECVDEDLFNEREEVLKEAKKPYEKFKGKLWGQIKILFDLIRRVTMCEHKNIIVAHYANEETKKRIGCRVRCADCDGILFKTKDKGKELAYEYIENNKERFDTLDDLTCDELNNRFGIKEQEVIDKMQNFWV